MMDNLLIDKAVMLDCHRGKRNLSVAWIDVRKAYDSVDHDWLCAMTNVHRLPVWLSEVIRKLCASWNTKVVATTRKERETSRKVGFIKGLPQGDALCPRLFTLCLNPVAWRLGETEGYRLSKPIGVKVTDLLYIDDLKVFAASERSDAGHRPPLESEKVLSGTREEGSPSARRVWYEDGRDNYHHGSWGRKTLQITGGARERSTG